MTNPEYAEEARAIVQELLPLIDTLSKKDRAFLEKWARALERGVEVGRFRLQHLRNLKAFVESGGLKVRRAA